MIVMIGGVKGGTGKSTVACNLAAHLADQGADVLLLDIDPQASSYKWALRRQAGYPEAAKVHCAQASGRTFDVVRDVAARYEHVVIDSGGHASDAMKSAMLACQKLYVPLRPSQADLETVGEMSSMVLDVAAFNPGLRALALIAMASTNPAVLEAQEARAALADIPGLALSGCVIHDRKVYRDALFEGVGVVEMTRNKASDEIARLAQEVFGG